LQCEFLEQNVQEKQHAFEMSAVSFLDQSNQHIMVRTQRVRRT